MSDKVIQTINAPVDGHVAGGDVHVSNTIHNHGPVYVICTPPAHVDRQERRVRPRPSHKTNQSQVLALMDCLPDRIAVLDFMDREFGTRMVVDLDSRELFRLRRYVEVILTAQVGK